MTIVCCTNTLLGFLFLKETYAPVLLAQRCYYAQKEDPQGKYRFEGQDDRPLKTKLGISFLRPLRILFTQPIVLTMAAYQAVIFG